MGGSRAAGAARRGARTGCIQVGPIQSFAPPPPPALPAIAAAPNKSPAKLPARRSPARPRRRKSKPKEPPGRQLFSEGESALSWDSDVLAEIQALHSRDFSDKEVGRRCRCLAVAVGAGAAGLERQGGGRC